MDRPHSSDSHHHVGGFAGDSWLGMTVCEIGRKWLRFRESTDREAEHTRRVALAMEGTHSRDRTAVVRACAGQR